MSTNTLSLAPPFYWVLPLVTLLAELALPVGVVLVIVGLVRYFRPAVETAEDILDRRYAAGEISFSEYNALRQDLGLAPRPERPHE